MSDARALAATEKCRDLVADPSKMGLSPRPGLEPLDVSVKFNRAASHTSSAFQIHVNMKLSLDGSGAPPFTDATALVAQGRTEAEALEVFFNWMADDGAVARFVEVVKGHEAQRLDALAQAAIAETKAEESRVASRARENNQGFLERKLDSLGRKFGFVKGKVQTP